MIDLELHVVCCWPYVAGMSEWRSVRRSPERVARLLN